MELDHLFNDIFRTAAVSEAPSCHCKSFGKSVNDDRPLTHPRKTCDGNMLRTVGEFGINLIRNHIQVVLFYKLGDGLKIFPGHDRPRRIVRERHDEHLRLRRHMLFKLFHRQLEFILILQRDDDRNAVRHHSAGQIGHIARLREQHLVPRIQHAAEPDIDRLTPPDCDKRLLLGIIRNADLSLQISADLISQLLESCVGCVKCPSLFKREDSFLTDPPRRVKVRLSHTQGDRILHLIRHVEKPADA